MRTLALREQTGGLTTYTPGGGAGGGGGGAAYPIRFTGTAGIYASSPDSVLNSWAGDLDIRVKCSFASMVPSINQSMVAKRNADGSAGSWSFRLNTGSGTLDFPFWNSLSGVTIPSSQVALGTTAGIVANQICWVRATLDVDNGAGGNTTRFYYSLDGLYWVPLGSAQVNAGMADVGDFANLLIVGGTLGQEFAGTIHYAEVRGGIDGPILAKFDPALAGITTATTPAVINGWTWNGTTLYKRDDYVRLPGTAGNYLSYPDTVANSVTGDIDIRVHLSLDNWSAASQCVLGKWDSTTNQREYLLRVDANTITLFISLLGSDTIAVGASAALSFANGSAGWIRVTRVQSTGVSTWQTSLDGQTWAILTTSSPVSAGVAMFDSNQPVQIGAQNAGGTGNPLAGNVYYAEVRNGIDGPVVARFDPRTVQTPWVITGSGWTWDSSQAVSTRPVLGYLLQGVSGTFASMPDNAAAQLVGSDLDIRISLVTDSWAVGGTGQTFLNKRGGTFGGYEFRISAAGVPELVWGNGTNNNFYNANAVIPGAVNGVPLWLRTTLVLATGTLKFYVGDGTVWTPFGSPGSPGATTIGASAGKSIDIGQGNLPNFVGKILYVEVRAGIDGPVVVRFDPGAIAKQNRVGNLLAVADAGLESGVASWTPYPSGTTHVAITTSTVQALDGTRSLTMTGDGTTLIATATSRAAVGPVTPNWAYTASAWVRADTVTRSMYVIIDWYVGPAGAYISSTLGTGVVDTTSGWTQITASGVAPSNATSAVVRVQSTTNAGAGETHYVDRVSFTEMGQPTTTVQPGGTPNMLTPNQAGIETDATGWAPVTNAPTLARDTSQFLDGAASLSMTATNAGPATMAAQTSTSWPVVAGKSYTFKASFRAAATPRNVAVQINWLNAASTYLSTTTGASTPDTTTGWTEVTVTGVAPATAALALPVLYIPATPVVGEVHYADRMSLVETAAVWTMNGVNWDLVAA